MMEQPDIPVGGLPAIFPAKKAYQLYFQPKTDLCILLEIPLNLYFSRKPPETYFVRFLVCSRLLPSLTDHRVCFFFSRI